MPLTPEMSIYERTSVIEDALAKVLDRGPEMSVEASGSSSRDLAVYVIEKPYSDTRVGHELSDLARELELLL